MGVSSKSQTSNDKDILQKVKELLNKEWVWMIVMRDEHYVVEVNEGIYLR